MFYILHEIFKSTYYENVNGLLCSWYFIGLFFLLFNLQFYLILDFCGMFRDEHRLCGKESSRVTGRLRSVTNLRLDPCIDFELASRILRSTCSFFPCTERGKKKYKKNK